MEILNNNPGTEEQSMDEEFYGYLLAQKLETGETTVIPFLVEVRLE